MDDKRSISTNANESAGYASDLDKNGLASAHLDSEASGAVTAATSADGSASARSIHSVHFIGIGGVGMSGIAHVAHDQGMTVTGSDLKESRYTKQLKDAGVIVHIGHSANNIPGEDADPATGAPDVVVVTTAVLDNNPELIAAKERGLTIWHRAQMLAYLGVGLETLAVAGTHGKTTSSSMLASVLDAMGISPTFLIGGIVRAYGTNAHSGTGAYYVVEADESDKSFRYLSPAAVMVTNIVADHLDHYRDLNEIYEKFFAFISSVPDNGVVVVCGEDEKLTQLARKTGRRVLTYGMGEDYDIAITAYEPHGISSNFTLRLPDGRSVDSCVPQNPGRHNVLNAAGVIGLVDALGMDAQSAALAMRSFGGVKRRFDLVGEAGGVTVVDDYGHHPTEIQATISAASQLGYNNVHVLFQPHRYTRAKLFCEVLHDEFGAAFDGADTVTFMNVYPAGETPIPGVNGRTFLNVVLEHEGHPDAHYVPHRIDVVPFMADLAKPGDLVITMGAGDVTAIGPQLVETLSSQTGKQA
ncbi:MAG: UDP-N-acetylmuramate--L-alanine ligase [Eggerthellaceae bacterium]|nr:UDP-N-acetylmuramate--L-alanine ligase [Eggerthellaceae bacterium]